jgi:hypothetical protein
VSPLRKFSVWFSFSRMEGIVYIMFNNNSQYLDVVHSVFRIFLTQYNYSRNAKLWIVIIISNIY